MRESRKAAAYSKRVTIENKKCRIRSSDGRAVYLLKNATVLKDEKGEMIGAVESMTDITSLYMKEMELEELKQELRQEYWFMGLLGKSDPMQKLFEQIRNAADERSARADLRRKRHRQEPRGPGHPRPEQAQGRAVRRDELRVAQRLSARKRAVRPQEGLLHRAP